MTTTRYLDILPVTTYTYDASNRLTARSRSDGHTYTYDWSQRGQLLTEWTQGYLVRAFSYDGAGRMIEAWVFTQTTEFAYNGLGARLAVEVVGHGATTYALDLAAGNVQMPRGLFCPHPGGDVTHGDGDVPLRQRLSGRGSRRRTALLPARRGGLRPAGRGRPRRPHRNVAVRP